VAEHTSIRLVVADEQLTLAAALGSRLALEGDLAVVATVCSTEAMWRELADGAVDLLLLGIRHDSSVVDGTPLPVVLDELAQRHPGLRVVVMASSSDTSVVTRAVHIGIAGWVPKEAGIALLLDTIRGVSRDETWIPANLLTQVLASLGSREDRDSRLARLASLTPRERDVLRGIVDGLSRNDIAARLYLSPNTVRTHVQHVLRKLDVHSALTAAAITRDLVPALPGRLANGWTDHDASERSDAC
jgi:DNA-binding NarL/FixJ family response regulator